MGRRVCTTDDRFWTAAVAAKYARVSETLVKKSMVEGTLQSSDIFGNTRDLRTTQEWVDTWIRSLLSMKSPIQQAKDLLNNYRT